MILDLTAGRSPVISPYGYGDRSVNSGLHLGFSKPSMWLPCCPTMCNTVLY